MTKVGLKACTGAEISRTICELLQWKRSTAGSDFRWCGVWAPRGPRRVCPNWCGTMRAVMPGLSCKFCLFYNRHLFSYSEPTNTDMFAWKKSMSAKLPHIRRGNLRTFDNELKFIRTFNPDRHIYCRIQK
jgi:hypothetical protein